MACKKGKGKGKRPPMKVDEVSRDAQVVLFTIRALRELIAMGFNIDDPMSDVILTKQGLKDLDDWQKQGLAPTDEEMAECMHWLYGDNVSAMRNRVMAQLH